MQSGDQGAAQTLLDGKADDGEYAALRQAGIDPELINTSRDTGAITAQEWLSSCQGLSWSACANAKGNEQIGSGLGWLGLGVGTKTAGEVESGVKGYGDHPDFYTRTSGETIPSIGYRYVSSDSPYLQDLLSTGIIPANGRGTYISFDNPGSGAAGKLQVPHDAAIKIEFDTKQILNDVNIPQGQWGKADYLEPITSDFPQFGPGGATQAVTTKPIFVNKVIDTNTGKVLYDRGK